MFKKSLRFYGLLFICLEVSKSQNKSFFLSKKYNNNNYICATNSSDALSWINEAITERLDVVSSYTPTTQSNNFNCDIKNDKQTKRYFIKQPWTLQKSIETHLNDVILDERWEEFPVIKTDYNNREGSRLEYTNVLNIQNTDFVIPLSIRLEQEGHIFLCDGTNPSTSSCYWFMLQAFRGTASSIRKCQPGIIPSVNNIYPSGSCKVRRVNSTHSQDFLTNKKWSHFILSKQKQILTFSTIVDHKKSKILEWEDTENPIPVSNLFVHSKVFNGLWKVHNLDFIYTRDVNKKVNLGSEILVLNNTVCISMYISMCSSCQIQLSLTTTSENIDNRTFEATQSGWNHIKYITENVTVRQVRLHVHTMGGNQDSYWAIDKVRLCQKKEFRIIGLSEEVKCQLISGSEVIQYDRHTRNDDDNDAKNNCPENTVGDFCMPCEMIYGDCKEITICTKDRCTCSAGYRSDVCYSECERGYYGHGCQRQCGKCHYCNNVDGTCRDTCTDNYTGSKCDIPPSIFFAVPPHVNSVSYTEAKISVSNFRVENHLNSHPQNYALEYKKAQNFDMPWTATNEFSLFNQPHEFTIKDLEPETSYIVRSVIILANNHWEVGDHLKYTKFTTACQDIDESNINIDVCNTTANVSLLQTTNVTCKLYTISLLENGQSGESNNNRTFFKNLTPFTEYTVIFKRKEKIQKKRFKTLEGVPSEIKSLYLKTISSTSIELRWGEPRKINGELKYYSVDYEHQRYLGCNFAPNAPIEKNNKTTKDTSITVTNLKPYSSYTFNVAVVNGKFKGPSISESAETQPLNKIEKDEIPTISLAENSLHFSSITCEKFRGPLILSITTTCVSEWCQNSTQSQKTESRTLDSQIDINDLIPFSDYNLDLKFCRHDTVCTETQNRSFKSEPTEPPQVQNLLAYTKNSSSISLRWEPPYPPNGNLKEYKITYYDDHKVNQKEIIFKKTPCKIWPNLHCATLHNLKKKHLYKINISARNQKPNIFGPSVTSQKIKTVIEKSDPPYDLKIEWTKQNDLKLEWKHPNKSNGDVKFFNIWCLENEQKPKQLNVENKYNLTYYYEIKAQEFSPTTEYRIFVAANNSKESDPVTQNSTSPPEIPKISTETQFENSNDTIMVSFSLDKPQGKSDGYQIFVLKPGSQNSKNFDNELSEFKVQNMKKSLICEVNPAETPKLKIILGSNQGNSGCTNEDNPPLTPGTSYNITIVVINKFKNISRASVYSYAQRTLGEVPSEVDPNLFGLLVLLLVIPLFAVLYLKRHDLMSMKNSFFKENNASREALDNEDEQVPLSHVVDTNVPKKAPIIQPKPIIDPNTKKVYSKRIKLTEFENYVKESIRNGELEKQHSLFPRGQTKPWKYGTIKENKSKNRYNNLIAYDHSRVILEKIEGKQHSDYINASYIDGHKVSKAYIATQGPKVATLDDFWRMIWQENVRHIANLANIYEGGKKKLEKYWPDINESLEFDSITVQYVTSKVFADYEHRVFTVTHNQEARKVEQLHFSSWPDHGVPLYSQSLVPFLQKMLQVPVSTKSPILVHCSAGVGRTGTILLCDISLRMAAREGTIDLLRTLQNLREQRANMVDNIEQYKLAHLVVLECLMGLHTSIQCNDIERSVKKMLNNETLTLQMRYLEDTHWQDQAMKTVGQTEEEPMIVEEKNRFGDIIPEIQGRVFISRCPPEDDTSSYINAVKVDGFRCPGRFIVTQQPLPNTLGDFWRLIDENTTTTHAIVVSLNKIDSKDPTSCHFWPTKTHPRMIPVPHIALNHINTLPLECYDVVTVHLNSQSRQEPLQVQILALKNWAPKTSCPEKIEEFLSFWEQISSAGKGANPIFVTCYDGVTASGLFVAMSFIIEKMKLEQVCDVCQAVRNVRHNRPQFVRELEQFEFLYKAAVLYINGFESYANFN